MPCSPWALLWAYSVLGSPQQLSSKTFYEGWSHRSLGKIWKKNLWYHCQDLETVVYVSIPQSWVPNMHPPPPFCPSLAHSSWCTASNSVLWYLSSSRAGTCNDCAGFPMSNTLLKGHNCTCAAWYSMSESQAAKVMDSRVVTSSTPVSSPVLWSAIAKSQSVWRVLSRSQVCVWDAFSPDKRLYWLLLLPSPLLLLLPSPMHNAWLADIEVAEIICCELVWTWRDLDGVP